MPYALTNTNFLYLCVMGSFLNPSFLGWIAYPMLFVAIFSPLWIIDHICEIPRRLERKTKHVYKGMETSLYQTRFKNLERKPGRESPKMIIFSTWAVTNGIRVRHGWCSSEDARPPRGMDCEIPHRLERRTKHCL